jgi:hypothetical protein
MPFFTLLIHGEGIRLAGSDDGKPITGFYTSRTVWAVDQCIASAKAVASVRQVWSQPSYARSNSGAFPILSVESCEPADFLKWVRGPNSGHTFYSERIDAA